MTDSPATQQSLCGTAFYQRLYFHHTLQLKLSAYNYLWQSKSKSLLQDLDKLLDSKQARITLVFPLLTIYKKVEKLSPLPSPPLQVQCDYSVAWLGFAGDWNVKLTIRPYTSMSELGQRTIQPKDQHWPIVLLSYKSRASNQVVFKFTKRGTQNEGNRRLGDAPVIRSIACYLW